MTTIYFNNSTGSDTAASGAGPSTAITGTAAAHTNGVASTTITLTNSPDLTNVLTNGTHAIWLATTSGRRLSFITAKDNTAKTVTVGDSFTIASGSAVDYAIGGKRQTLMGSSQLFTDTKGWTYILEYTGTNYTVNATISATASTFNIYGDSATNLTVIEMQHNGIGFQGGGNGGFNNGFRNIKAISTSATKTTGSFYTSGNASVTVYNCVFGDSVNRLYRAINTSNTINRTEIWNTAIIHCIANGLTGTGPNGTFIDNCLIANNGTVGIDADNGMRVSNSVIYSNVTGLRVNSGSPRLTIQNCIFESNTNAIANGWGSPGGMMMHLVNNIFRNNSVGCVVSNNHTPIYGWNLALGNVFFNNGYKYPGLLNVIVQDEVDADPQFANPAAYNFTIGNAAVKGKSYPQTVGVVPLATFYNYGTAGPAQPQAAGGGGLLLPRAMNGGYSA